MKHIHDYLSKPGVGEIDRLVSEGVLVDEKNASGVTSFMMAACLGYFSCAERLLELGASIDEKDNNGDTALMMAVYRGMPSSVKFLLEHGANPSLTDKEGQSLIEIAFLDKSVTHDMRDKVISILDSFGINTKRESMGPTIHIPSLIH